MSAPESGRPGGPSRRPWPPRPGPDRPRNRPGRTRSRRRPRRKASAAPAIAFCDELASAARIRPADVPALAELVLRLDADAPAPCFAAPDSPKAPLAPGLWLRGWLGQVPPLVEMGETATAARARGPGSPMDFAAPSGYSVDPAALAVHRRALAWLEAHPESTYQAAVVAVAGA